jgi:hypothetical protein
MKFWLRAHLPHNVLSWLSFVNRYVYRGRSFIARCLYAVVDFFFPKKVSFIIVGAQKSGTTALWHFLGEHPDISPSLIKETSFFSTDANWEKGADYKAYRRQFELFPGRGSLGEASPSYMIDCLKVAPRIARYNPAVKLIFILRNPAERVYSQYKMHRAKYGLSLTFEECLEIARAGDGEYKVLDKASGFSTETITSYLEFGQYVGQIKTFLDLFDRKQMLFLRTEELVEQHTETLNKVFSFLNVKPFPVQARVIHSHDYIPMSEEAREFLRREYFDSISELESLIDWDLSHWK